MIAINFKVKINEKAQFTNVNEHFEAVFNVEIGSKGGFAKASINDSIYSKVAEDNSYRYGCFLCIN